MVEQPQGGTAQKSEINQRIGVAGTGSILAKTGIAPPVVTVLHSGPVSTHQL
jgi:hypothetical protein